MRNYKKQEPKILQDEQFTKLTFNLIAIEFPSDITTEKQAKQKCQDLVKKIGIKIKQEDIQKDDKGMFVQVGQVYENDVGDLVVQQLQCKLVYKLYRFKITNEDYLKTIKEVHSKFNDF